MYEKEKSENGKGKMKILKNKNIKIGGAIFYFPFSKFHTFTNFHMFYKYNATLIPHDFSYTNMILVHKLM
jgi:hypothetical protein